MPEPPAKPSPMESLKRARARVARIHSIMIAGQAYSRYGVFTPYEIPAGPFAQEAFLGSKVDWVANCFHQRSSSLPMRGGTWMETPT